MIWATASAVAFKKGDKPPGKEMSPFLPIPQKDSLRSMSEYTEKGPSTKPLLALFCGSRVKITVQCIMRKKYSILARFFQAVINTLRLLNLTLAYFLFCFL